METNRNDRRTRTVYSVLTADVPADGLVEAPYTQQPAPYLQQKTGQQLELQGNEGER